MAGNDLDTNRCSTTSQDPSAPSVEGLIARLESASEGSEELNKAIAAEVLILVDAVQLQGSPVYIPMFRYPNGSVGTELRFTQSLDAALTLIPGKAHWSVSWPVGEATLIYGGRPSVYASGGTAPLALCIAALKARAASSPIVG